MTPADHAVELMGTVAQLCQTAYGPAEGAGELGAITNPYRAVTLHRFRPRAAGLLLLVIAALVPQDAHAQLGRLRSAARSAAGQVVDRTADAAAERAAREAEAAIGGPSTDSPSTPDPAGPAAAAPSVGALVNYDFVPGERVLFADDLADGPLGDFPGRLRFVEGNAETAEVSGERWLRFTSWGAFAIELPEALPDRFTLEFEAAVPGGWYQDVHFTEDAATRVTFWPFEGGIDGGVRAKAAPAAVPGPGVAFPVRVMADGEHVKVYMNGTRVANVPTAALGRSRQIRFTVRAGAENPALFGRFRVAAGGRDLYAVAEAVADPAPQAPLVLHGVTFETASATLRPESAPTLDAVAASLAGHPDVRVRIEGHTDSTGPAETNRQLSEARARAVLAYLAAKGVAPERMEAAGFGPDQPVADNATPEGRQQNRRVALARL